MKSILKLEGNEQHRIKIDTFPGGEVNVTVPDTIGTHLWITAWIHDSDGLMALAQLKSVLDAREIDVRLKLPYVPYARQDRVCNYGESLAIKVFANMINAMNFVSVEILDPHSDVTSALIDRVIIQDKETLMGFCGEFENYDVFVAPDAGATKEVQKLAITYGKEFVQGTKIRDPKTGALSGFGYHGDIEDKSVLVIDDLCDAGGTFLGLAAELEKGKPSILSLYVTHGMFTKGTSDLVRAFDTIYTTNSFISDIYKNTNAGINCIYKV